MVESRVSLSSIAVWLGGSLLTLLAGCAAAPQPAPTSPATTARATMPPIDPSWRTDFETQSALALATLEPAPGPALVSR